jgi:hypothetical protein
MNSSPLARWFFALPLLLALHCWGAEPRRLDELMEKSGMNKQLAETQAQVRAGFEQALAEGKANGSWVLGAEDTSSLMRAMGGSFAAGPMKAVVRRELERLLHAADETVVLEWLATPLGRRLTRLEEEAAKAEPAGMMREAGALFSTLAPARVELVRRMVDAVDAPEAVAASTINMMTAILYGMSLSDPALDAAAAMRKVREILEPQRAAMVAEANRVMLQTFAWVYRTVSDEDLEGYARFAESPAGRRYHQASVKAIEQATVEASVETGRQFEALRRQKRQRS